MSLCCWLFLDILSGVVFGQSDLQSPNTHGWDKLGWKLSKDLGIKVGLGIFPASKQILDSYTR